MSQGHHSNLAGTSHAQKHPLRKAVQTSKAHLHVRNILSRTGSSTITQAAASAARLLVCSYFLNSIYEECEAYAQMATPEMREKTARFPDHYIAAPFPILSILLLLPCATLAAAGIHVRTAATVLMMDMTRDTIILLWQQLSVYIIYKLRPDELAMKRLAMFGCSALMLAHSTHSSLRGNSYAGVLQQKPASRLGFVKSVVLLAGRLLVAALFFWFGLTQILRIIARDWAIMSRYPFHEGHPIKHDGHDNNWLLLEFALALPFALGFKTSLVSKLLIGVLLVEAGTCWQFWREWPTWRYTAHVRSHFATNLGVCGGLLLLQGLSAGRYTLDEVLKKKD